ncbi:MAG TPA: alpha/beta fold hydrolase [Candidatus Limnocylindrales bacterium]|nr:alpha/beta fold hydrolase [Candidatus Limnocylindrales bacterium]
MIGAGFPSYESRTVSIDGVSVHYLCGGRGTPLVLVHGLGSSATVEFYFNLEALAASHRVYAVDLPGFGKSDKPPIEYTIEFFVRVLRDFMVAHGLDRVALMGVSLGGRIAVGFALEYPSHVSRLVLVDALGVGVPRRVLAYSVLLARGIGELALSGTARALRQMNPRLIRRLWRWHLARPGPVDHLMSDDRIDHHREMLGTPAYRAAYLSALRSVAGMRRMRDGILVEDRLGGLSMPTLLVWGRHDHVFPPSHAEEAAKRIPNVDLEIFEGSGHTPQMEEPDRFNRLVEEFLGRP